MGHAGSAPVGPEGGAMWMRKLTFKLECDAMTAQTMSAGSSGTQVCGIGGCPFRPGSQPPPPAANATSPSTSPTSSAACTAAIALNSTRTTSSVASNPHRATPAIKSAPAQALMPKRSMAGPPWRSGPAEAQGTAASKPSSPTPATKSGAARALEWSERRGPGAAAAARLEVHFFHRRISVGPRTDAAATLNGKT